MIGEKLQRIHATNGVEGGWNRVGMLDRSGCFQDIKTQGEKASIPGSARRMRDVQRETVKDLPLINCWRVCDMQTVQQKLADVILLALDTNGWSIFRFFSVRSSDNALCMLSISATIKTPNMRAHAIVSVNM